jgi:phage FluMu gp28-like protein
VRRSTAFSWSRRRDRLATRSSPDSRPCSTARRDTRAGSCSLAPSGSRKSSWRNALVTRAPSPIVADLWEDDDIKPNKPQILELRFANGSKIVGLPANADTARGISGNLILDEFAFHEDPDGIWRGAMPAITRGFKLRIISTPNGKRNRFYRLVRGDLRQTLGARAQLFSVDIHTAIAQGLAVDVEQLRAAAGDPETFAQEYELKYLDETEMPVLTNELILAAENEGATTDFAEDFAPIGSLFSGFDVGRKKDLSIIWTIEKVGDVSWTRRVRKLEKMKFSEQREELYAVLRNPKSVRACIDATGLGMQLAEEAIEEFGDFKVEGVTFNEATKTDMATRIRRRFEDRAMRVPSLSEIRDDLHSVMKVPSPNGAIRFVADRGANGHADRFWALALAERAADNQEEPHIYSMSGVDTDRAARTRRIARAM